MHLKHALASEDPETRAIRSRILDLLPKAQREALKADLDYFHNEIGAFGEYQSTVLRTAWHLQEEGAIRPAPRRKPQLPKGTIDIERFSDLAGLTDYEIQRILREVDTADAAVALTGARDLTSPRSGA